MSVFRLEVLDVPGDLGAVGVTAIQMIELKVLLGALSGEIGLLVRH